MKHILITTDFSAVSRKAIRYTLRFFQSFNEPCHFFLLNAYLVPKTSAHNIIKLNDELKSDSNQGLQREQAWASEFLGTNSLESISAMGSLKNIIPRLIQEKKVDLLVMGKDGGRHLEDVTEVLKREQRECPLLAVF